MINTKTLKFTLKEQNSFFHNKLSIIGILFVWLFAGCQEDVSENPNTWTTYKADEKSSSYSPLDQINVSNVNQLQNAWTFQTNDLPPGDQAVSSQSNPIIIDGVMYANSAKQSVYAIHAQTGEQIWAFNALAEGEPSAASRGVTYWEKGSDTSGRRRAQYRSARTVRSHGNGWWLGIYQWSSR